MIIQVDRERPTNVPTERFAEEPGLVVTLFLADDV